MAKRSWRNLFSGELVTKYKDAIDWLDENYAFFLTHVLNIGEPNFTNQVPTAAVALPSKDAKPEDFEFLFNEAFLELLSVEDTAFILAHETMHIILNHLVLARGFVDHKRAHELDEKVKKVREGGPVLTPDEENEMQEQMQNMMIFNIAADCVINDYLVANGIPEPQSLPDGMQLMRGMKIVGHSCANCTVTEVFDEIQNQMKNKSKMPCPTCGGTGKKPQDQKDKGKQEKSDKGEKSDEKQDGQGQGEDQDEKQDGESGGGQDKQDDHDHGDSGEPCPDCQGTGEQPGSGSGGAQYSPLDSHDWMHKQLTPEDVKNMKELWEQIKDHMPTEIEDLRDDIAYESGMKMAGNEAGAINEFAVEKGVTLAWVELLKEIDPDLFKGKGVSGAPPKVSWHQPRRKIAHQYPDLILPVKQPAPHDPRKGKEIKKKPSIVMALDTSGSISRKDAARFVALAQSVPKDKIDMWVITFTTQWNELDLDNPRYGSGGTDFSAIEDYIQKKVVPELGHYPKAVVAITDGCAEFFSQSPPVTDYDSWFWLITDSFYGNYGQWAKVGKQRKLDEFVDHTRY